MRFRLVLAGAALLLAAAPLAAQAPQPEAAASAQAMAELDVERLLVDRDYAEQMLGHVARFEEIAPADRDLGLSLDNIRLIALTTLGRGDDALAVADRIAQQRPRLAFLYASAWHAAVLFEDHRRAVEVAATAARSVPASEWADLRAYLDRQTTWAVVRGLRQAEDEANLVRLAESLLRIGWPGADDRQSADSMRRILIDARLDRGERRAAADLAAGVVTPDGVLPLLLLTRYDQLIGEADRLEQLRQAIAAEDRETAAALAASPDDRKRRLNRVQHLRAVGRNAEAAALVAPLTADVAATVAADEDGMWLVNDAAYALVADGRPDEGVELMRRLAALSVDDNPSLISAAINFGELLFETGRPREALDHALRLEREASQHASDYGDMWILDTIVCSLAALDRSAEAAPWIERMRALDDANEAALTHAYLCLGEDDAAAELMVRRLGDDNPSSAVLALQDYALSEGTSQDGALQARLLALRERPDVRAALDRVGRVMTLPLSRAYWGNF